MIFLGKEMTSIKGRITDPFLRDLRGISEEQTVLYYIYFYFFIFSQTLHYLLQNWLSSTHYLEEKAEKSLDATY